MASNSETSKSLFDKAIFEVNKVPNHEGALNRYMNHVGDESIDRSIENDSFDFKDADILHIRFEDFIRYVTLLKMSLSTIQEPDQNEIFIDEVIKETKTTISRKALSQRKDRVSKKPFAKEYRLFMKAHPATSRKEAIQSMTGKYDVIFETLEKWARQIDSEDGRSRKPGRPRGSKNTIPK